MDARADLYAAGAVLYECLTGRPPNVGAGMTELFAKVLGDEPARPSSMAADIQAALDELAPRLLAKRPADRVQSAAEPGRPAAGARVR